MVLLKERNVAVCGSRFLADELQASPDDSDNSVSESLDEFDYSVAEISRSFRSQQEICEQLNINHMIQRIFLITLDNSELHTCSQSIRCLALPAWVRDLLLEMCCIWWVKQTFGPPWSTGLRFQQSFDVT